MRRIKLRGRGSGGKHKGAKVEYCLQQRKANRHAAAAPLLETEHDNRGVIDPCAIDVESKHATDAAAVLAPYGLAQ